MTEIYLTESGLEHIKEELAELIRYGMPVQECEAIRKAISVGEVTKEEVNQFYVERKKVLQCWIENATVIRGG